MARLEPADDLAIREVVHRYADAVVHRDADQWGSCFADDATWDLGRAKANSRAAAVDLFVRAMGNMQAVVQVVHNGAARGTDDPDRATGRWYIEERYRLADGTPGILAAHYDDEYVRGVDGEWRFASRVLTIQYAGPPDLSAPFLNSPDGLRAAGESPERVTGATGMDRWITDWEPSTRFPHYTRSNAGEVLPTPASPLGQQFTWEHGICFGWRDGYVRQGAYALDEFDPVHPDVAGFFGGYLYINLSTVRMQAVRGPALTVEQLDLAIFGDHPDVPTYVAHPDDDRPELLPGIGAHLGWVMSTTSWPEIDAERAETTAYRRARPDLAALDDAALLARARETQPMLQKLFESHTVSSSSSAIAPGIFAAIGAAIGDPTIPMKLVAGIGEVDSAEPSYALWELSRLVRGSAALTAAFDAGVDGLLDRLGASTDADAQTFVERFGAFLADYGSRGPNEWEISAETWETHPELALAAIGRVRLQDDGESPHARQAHVAAAREALTAELRTRLAPFGEELAGQFEAALVAAHQLAFRERTKTNIIRVVHEGRMVFRELGRRHAAAGDLADALDVFMLLDAELETFVADPAACTETLATRHRQWRELWDLVPPYFVVDGTVPPIGGWERRADRHLPAATVGEVFHGVAGCPGKVVGTARVVTDPGEPGDMGPDDILVAPLTDPAWTPLFMAVGGVVVDVGGQISHAIIVSRELGLPCVVSATGASERIADGSTIEVDADHGTVTVLAVPAR